MGVIFRAIEVYVDAVMNDTCHCVTVQTKSNLIILVIQGYSVSHGGIRLFLDVFASGIGDWKAVLSMILEAAT
jgi:hypothetical protein